MPSTRCSRTRAARQPAASPNRCLTLTGVDSQELAVHARSSRAPRHLRRLRPSSIAAGRTRILISEAYVGSAEELTAFYGGGDEMHLPFNFFLAQVPHRDAAAMRDAVERVERACNGRWPSNVFSNHDIDRACDRFAAGADPDAVARLLAMLLLTLRGTPFIYYGEEIAMRTDPPRSIEEVRDPVGRRFWPAIQRTGRCSSPDAVERRAAPGFTRGTPWLRGSHDAAGRNVGSAGRRSGIRFSILSFAAAGPPREPRAHVGRLSGARRQRRECSRIRGRTAANG